VLSAYQPQFLQYFIGHSIGGEPGHGGGRGKYGAGGHGGYAGRGGKGGSGASYTVEETYYTNGERRTRTLHKKGDSGSTGPSGTGGYPGPEGKPGANGGNGSYGPSGKVIYRHVSTKVHHSPRLVYIWSNNLTLRQGEVLGEGTLFNIKWLAPSQSFSINSSGSFTIEGISLQNIGSISLPAGAVVRVSSQTPGLAIVDSPPGVVPTIISGAFLSPKIHLSLIFRFQLGATVRLTQPVTLQVATGLGNATVEFSIVFGDQILPKSAVIFNLSIN